MNQKTFLIVVAVLVINMATYAQRETFKRAPGQPIDQETLLVLLLEKNELTLSNEILFQHNSTEFAEQTATGQLETLALVLKHPKLEGATFDIEGHTCDLGTEPYNQKLSDDRAAKVLQFLVDHGVNEKQLSSKGFGESKPVPGSDTSADLNKEVLDERRVANRRVVIRRIQK